MKSATRWLSLFVWLVVSPLLAQTPGSPFPEDHWKLEKTISYAEMDSFLKGLDGKGPVALSVEGTTVQGRSLYLVHLSRGGNPSWRILFYAQQHGDEISGKDALLYLVRDIARNPALLPRNVDLWLMPMVNPDGAEARTRKNGAGADLNRDHVTLDQPETQALHRVARRLRPHIAVDCHEFRRDSESYLKRGILKWPDITMDGLNNPLFDQGLIGAAQRWVEEAGRQEAKAGHPFLRYWVGGAPPDEEQRHSAPDIDGGLNGLGMYGGLSFIIEAAASDPERSPFLDLGKRVDAYLVLLKHFIKGDGHLREDLASIERSRSRPLPPFLPVNYFWVNPGAKVTEFPVIDQASGRLLKIPTANMMTEMAVKRTVAAPLGYAIEPRAAQEFRLLLDRHGIPYQVVDAPRPVRAERGTLLRVEEEFDDVYSRYEGRQIVRREEARALELLPGSLWVPLEGEASLRAALVLEPASIYGLFAYPRFRALAGPEGSLPVLRVVR